MASNDFFITVDGMVIVECSLYVKSCILSCQLFKICFFAKNSNHLTRGSCENFNLFVREFQKLF